MAEEYEVRFIRDAGVEPEQTAPLLHWLAAHGADEFSVTVMALDDMQAPYADAFEDELEEFEKADAVRVLPSSSLGEEPKRPVRLWALDEESLPILLSYLDDGLFELAPGPDGWLEDLAIFRKGELVLGVVSHEREGVLRLTAREHEQVAALGIRATREAEWISY
ncbi:MAG TPA: hypothetical protein VGD77_09585 [Gemmatimonadaceae bacterium]